RCERPGGAGVEGVPQRGDVGEDLASSDGVEGGRSGLVRVGGHGSRVGPTGRGAPWANDWSAPAPTGVDARQWRLTPSRRPGRREEALRMAVLLSAPILLSITLLISGLAKLGAREGTQDAMRSLRLPLPMTHASVASVLPAMEIFLALALWIPVPPLQVLLAGLVTALLFIYLVIIARALTFEEQVHCACFGTLASPTVSRTTLVRNVILSVLGLLTVVAAASGAMTTLLVQAPLGLIGLGLALLTAIALAAATIGGSVADPDADAATAPAPAAADPDEDELLDYERSPIPAAVLQQPDGRLITLT